MKLSALGMGSILFVCFLAPGIAMATTPEAWSLDKRENGIDVYTRPIEGSGIKEFKGVADVDADIDAIIALLRDSDRFKTWFPNTSESMLLGRDGDISYQYSVMSTPWPMEDRDNVLRSVARREEKTGIVHITLTAAPKLPSRPEGPSSGPESPRNLEARADRPRQDPRHHDDASRARRRNS